jgi:hypothetical protein
MTPPKLYTAIDLIHKLLDFIEMTPDSGNWSLLSQKDNLPRYIRLLQIHSLLKAFYNLKITGELLNSSGYFAYDSNEVIKSFKSGEFVAFRQLCEYTPVISFIQSYVKNKDIYVSGSLNIGIKEIQRVFTNLLNYKQYVNNLERFNSGYLAASSIHTVFSIELTNSISSAINCYYLNRVLSLIVSPNTKTFTEQQLLYDFDYPPENLADIDLDYI